MRSKNSEPSPWHFVATKPGAEASFRRWNLVVISILALLVLGVLTVALIPEMGSAVSATTNSR